MSCLCVGVSILILVYDFSIGFLELLRQCGIYFHCSRTVPRYYKYASMSDSHVSTRCQRFIGGFHVLLEESLVIQPCLQEK